MAVGRVFSERDARLIGFTLMRHQALAIARAKPLGYFGLFFEPGTGKTCTAIQLIRYWTLKERRFLRTLVIGPNIVAQNWHEEFRKFSQAGEKVTCLSGQGCHRLKQMRENKNPIVISAYETLIMPTVLEEIKKWKPEILIIDESHRVKNPVAKRTKKALELASLAKYKLILTGTPILNSAMDLYTQVEILGKADLLGQDFFAFRGRFFADANAGMPKAKYFPDWRIRPRAMEEISKIISPFCMSVKKSECLDLPPLTRQEVFVPLSPEQLRLYDAMKKDFIAYVGDEACTASLALTKGLRLQQIVSGFVTLEGQSGEDPKNVEIKDNPRAKALKELLEDIAPTAKVIIWAVFRENYKAIRKVCESLSLKYVEVHGEVPGEDRQRNLLAFDKDPDVRIFIGHPGSGGIGVNLTAASHSIYYSRSFSLENDLQSEARNYRRGSEVHAKLTRIDLVAKGTIDEIVLRKLACKVEIGNNILRDIAREISL